MTATPRPTRAQYDAAIAARDSAQTAAEERLDHIETLRSELAAARKERITDPEAEALSACVQAITAMFERQRNHRTDGFAMSISPRWDPTPPAHRSPVGRILLALAARYDVAIEAALPDPPETRLIGVPADLADQIHQLIR